MDMSVEELKAYLGSTPCPADFDAYWEAAKREADGLDYQVEMVENSFSVTGADCYDLYFTGTKGARIHSRVALPAGVAKTGKIPAVLLFHGLSDGEYSWTSLLPHVLCGRAAVSMAVRGQGGGSEDAGGVPGTTYTTPFIRGLDGEKNDLLMRDVFLDTYILAKVIMGLSFVDENRIAVTGGSQGGALSLVCASLVPQVKKCAVFSSYLSDYKRMWDMGLSQDAYEGLRYYFRQFDPRHERETEVFTRLGYIDVQNFVKWIRADVITATGLCDTICLPSAQFASYNKITAPKKHYFYPDFGHEELHGYDDIIMEFFEAL